MHDLVSHSPSFRCSVSIPIRYADIDAQRHLNNVAYFAFMEHARVEYLRETGLWSGRDFESIGMIVAETSCDYRAPGFLGETVTVWTRVSHLGNKSFRFEYRMQDKASARLVCEGRSVQVMYDYQKQQSMRLDERMRKAVSELEQLQLAELSNTQ